MLITQVESFKAGLDELKVLLPIHYEELALNKDKVPLDPIYEEYFNLEDIGRLLYLTLREEGELIGYFIGFIAPHLHYKTMLMYTMDIFYVNPKHRGKRGGCILITALEQELKRRGVHKMVLGSKCHKDASVLFERFGMTKIETYYSKWIGD